MTLHIVCDHELRPEYRKRIGSKEPPLLLSAHPRLGNVYLRRDRLEASLGRPLDSLSLDLCEIAAYVYLADKAVPRGKYEDWARDLSFLIPVRNPGRWRALTELLTHTVGTLSGDNVRFRFVARSGEDPPGREPDEASPSCDSVALFSGGLDSFAGAIHLVHEGFRPLLASHYVSGLKSLQHHLVGELKNELGVGLEHFQYRVTSQRTAETRAPVKARESSHRARSFLFMSLAAAAAAAHGVSRIFICENGVLSMNVPISDARKGTRSTRHAHPLYLTYFNQLINALFLREFSVENPFFYWTKREEVELVRRAGLERLLRETVSCWGYPNQTARFPDANHCGYCLPCLVRRVSVIEAGLEACDDNYVVDVFNLGSEPDPKQRRNIEDLLYFAESFTLLSKTELLYQYPELVMVESGPEPPSGSRIDEIIRLYRRFGGEVLSVARSRAPRLLASGVVV